eukprot:scaffold131456_cov17-Tisochrysis_lutea.AAC.2
MRLIKHKIPLSQGYAIPWRLPPDLFAAGMEDTSVLLDTLCWLKLSRQNEYHSRTAQHSMV